MDTGHGVQRLLSFGVCDVVSGMLSLPHLAFFLQDFRGRFPGAGSAKAQGVQDSRSVIWGRAVGSSTGCLRLITQQVSAP